MRKFSVQVLIIVFGCVLSIGAVGLYVFNTVEENMANVSSEKLLYGLTEYKSEKAQSAETNDNPEQTVILDETEIIGTISIPSIHITLPVASNWSYPNLKRAACRYSGTAENGKMIILAHNYNRHFGNLNTLHIGDLIGFTDINDKAYFYKVAHIETLHKTELDRLTDTDYPLTLFTCTYSGEERITVRCDRAE